MPADHDRHPPGGDLADPVEEAPESGDADVGDQRAGQAVKGERPLRLLCHRHVGRAGADDADAGGHRRRQAVVEHRRLRQDVEIEPGLQSRVKLHEFRRLKPGQEQRGAPILGKRDQPVDLGGRLAGAEHGLADADARLAPPVRIDAEIRHNYHLLL